jgi:uncharacterized protein
MLSQAGSHGGVMIDISVSSDTMVLSALIFGAAMLYSSVGHAGASGYIAAMALFGTAPAVMKPTALVLNILVAAIGTVRWHRLGLVNKRALIPLLLASIPCAFIGGAIQLPVTWYRLLLGVILIVAAATFLFKPNQEPTDDASSNVPVVGGVVTGGTVGFLSGITGTGGGIFLSPILLLMRWVNPRQASGITAPFILFNSIAGLAGNLVVLKSLPPGLPLFAAAALAGGVVGTTIGTSWASSILLQRLLGIVLLIAGIKFISV